MRNRALIVAGLIQIAMSLSAQQVLQYPSHTEVVHPIHKTSFNNEGTCPERRQGGNPRLQSGYRVFSGSMDGNRQVDPQIAVGGGYVMEGSNMGLLIFKKDGTFVQGVSQKCFNQGIDPKLFFDVHHRVFVFDLWWYYDAEKRKPVNIAVSETDDPTGAWNIYPVSRTEEVDGGGIGYSKSWVAYSYPGGEENTFVMKAAALKTGAPATVYHFKGSLGHPVFGQDDTEDLYFFDITDEGTFVIRRVFADSAGNPVCQELSRRPHQLRYFDYPPVSPQRGTLQMVASGDRNPKNLVLQNGSIWFSQTVNCEGRAAVQWHQVRVSDGQIRQTGIIRSDTSSFIQTTLAVNAREDVLIGFQEVNERSYVSPRMAFRKKGDRKGTLREICSLGEGTGATQGTSWGDYSGSIIDGDNLRDLWTIQSIANDKGRGETVIVRWPGN